jgi:hypothetical protein
MVGEEAYFLQDGALKCLHLDENARRFARLRQRGDLELQEHPDYLQHSASAAFLTTSDRDSEEGLGFRVIARQYGFFGSRSKY